MTSPFCTTTTLNRLAVSCVAIAGLFLAACSNESARTANPEHPAARVYEARGVVRGAPDLAGRSITIDHEDIPGFMPAMTMPFEFRDSGDVKGLNLGDTIAFKILVTSNDSWITDIRHISPTNAKVPKPKPAPPQTHEQRLKEGDRLPNVELVDQDGRTVRSETFAGKALVLTFIFTRCPIPNFCPRISQNFRALQQAIRTDSRLEGQVNLLSVSFDERDTPDALAAYGAHFSPDFDSWRFATGNPVEVKKLTSGFAVLVQPDGVTINHGLATALIDTEGVIRNIWRGNGWQPDEVLKALRTLNSNNQITNTTPHNNENDSY